MTSLESQLDTPFLKAIGAGALAAAIGLLIWYGLVLITDSQLNFVSAGVGWATGLAVAKKSWPNGSMQLRACSGLIALIAIFLGSYLTLNHLFLVSYPATQDWLSLKQFFILYQAQFNGGRGVIDLVSAMVGIYEAVFEPPGEPAVSEDNA